VTKIENPEGRQIRNLLRSGKKRWTKRGRGLD